MPVPLAALGNLTPAGLPAIYHGICHKSSSAAATSYGHPGYLWPLQYAAVLFFEYLLRIHKRPAPIGNPAGSYGKDIRGFQFDESFFALSANYSP